MFENVDAKCKISRCTALNIIDEINRMLSSNVLWLWTMNCNAFTNTRIHGAYTAIIQLQFNIYGADEWTYEKTNHFHTVCVLHNVSSSIQLPSTYFDFAFFCVFFSFLFVCAICVNNVNESNSKKLLSSLGCACIIRTKCT